MEQYSPTMLIIIFILIILYILLFISKKRVDSISSKKDEYIKNQDQEIKNLYGKQQDLQSTLDNTNHSLSQIKEKYSSIIDMETHCNKILSDSLAKSEMMKDQSDRLIDNAKNQASSILDNANKNALNKEEKGNAYIEDAKSQAETIINDAQILKSEATNNLKISKEKADSIKSEARYEAEIIIKYAEERAKEIAGSAYEAKEKADLYEITIKAMKNIIDGYKDDYIIPNHSVLDDLAEEFSYKEAGEELKKARKRVREMVKDGLAGSCDYVEHHRRTYAVHFAVDAFNGKVDSALAKVKHDNFGKIKQEIIDAYALVNHNGSPFRNARINQEFLDIRLDELKWAVRAHELRKIEREEQAEIKAQIREEERAIREMEKARKEAEKEERLIQKALEKARSELSKASEEQRAAYEAQLAELETKLHEAEEKGQRAISMAQQTRRGHVYVISNVGSFGEDVFKIGMTRRLEPMDRVKELGDASVPFAFDVHAMIYSDDAPALEKELHQRFNLQSVNKINPRKEFFRTSAKEVRQAVEDNGITDVHWTMKAEAAEYRESLSIEKEQKAELVVAD
ncbi:protein of unknown function [Vibrio xiamenensis]|uniref:Bacteriophage T5 Orf172 DNA-binding domain-containing protein n=1 Tax=Vibrio xiamenensis TaxID=861298 RepID=A0A1G8HES7_9VIBR|nr:DUF4041 domain-containing protein [Vibrio xiamenensis]SDI04970.1 protein of unknown function [Vibrio xiamenensis]